MSAGTLIRGGIVFDGAASAGRQLDLRIQGGRITEMAPRLAREGAREIDAGGAWVTPGFVDAHSHCDLSVLSGTAMELRARSGVTTEVVGQDGLGLAPAPGAAGQMMAGVLAPITGEAPPGEWGTVGDYLRTVDAGAFARVTTLVPHGAVRAQVMGGAPRPATAEERSRIAALVAAGMADGAVGLSTGLSYPPALWSDTQELIDAAAAMPAGGGRYVTHLRDYGAGFDDALEEALTIGTRSGRPVHLSHFHVSGPGRGGTAQRHLHRLRSAGVAVSWDSYPYTVACTFLTTVLPQHLQMRRGEDIAALLADPEEAASVAAALDREGPGRTIAVGWEKVLLAGLAGTALAGWDTRPVAEVARQDGRTSGEVVVEAVRRLAGQACILVPQGHADNVRAIAAAPEQVAGSDGIPGSGVPHPRAAGTFLRLLRWARDGVVEVGVADMVKRMTAGAAGLFGLPVGRLAEGCRGDVLVIDPAALDDGPDVGPWSPDAVRWSFLHGEPVLDDGRWLAPRLTGLALRGAGAA
ncbi:N-acyl-D-amino-acid deacylase family protein [Blastococcus atacamensis]|uniref:N-acyl-D-amino-acid deacylase family protein n=1 Tax=Blastococcus atacamensis TaxID=2070508 RepID=UPI000CEC3642|nr:amidohydrolase family protein [Blastococcus atacamensis]